MKTSTEQISAFEAKRSASAERMEAIMSKSADEGRTLDETETEEYDSLKVEVKAVDEHLVRLRDLERTQIARATEITDVTTIRRGTDLRSPVVQGAKSTLPKGTGFVRYAMALAASKGNLMQATEYAKKWKDSTPEVEPILKAAVAAGTTTDADWALPLVEYQTLANEFIELLRPQTIIGRIPNLRRVPFNVRMPSQTQGGVYGWVGEGAPKPVGELKFGELTLRWAKAAGIIVLTEELVRMSNPSAEAIVRQDMTAGIAAFLDLQFVNPNVAEVANVSPASITNTASSVVASGTDAAAVRTDVKALYQLFIAANLTPATGIWIMSSTTALALSLMFNALGQREFPDITLAGGTWLGLPVVVSEHVPTDSNGAIIILANASDILLADDGGVTLDVSREASLEMNDAPAGGATTLVSLWQNNLIGLRAERFINWKKRRAAAVAYIRSVNYGS